MSIRPSTSPRMPGTPLPDDMNQWPTDPFQLLGIDHSVSARDARRAFIRLIRSYKPEHAPQQFQVIREAFDYVQRQLEARDSYGNTWPEDSWQIPQLSAMRSEAAENRSTSFESGDTYRVRGALRDDEQQCCEAWQSAKEGRPAEAYARLISLLTGGACESLVCIRLYWVLTIAPEVDSQRAPCDWLTRAVRADRLSGPALELYRREVIRDRREACMPRCDELLEVDAPPHAIADVIDFRWRAFSYLQQWQRVVDDLPRVSDRVALDDEESWGRLLLLAMDQLAWFVNEHTIAANAFENCRREIEQLSHLHSALESELDQMDVLLELVEGWRATSHAVDVPRDWNNLVPLSWTQNYREVRPHLMKMVRQIAEQPLAALTILDRINEHSADVCARLGTLLERACYYEGGAESQHRDWDDTQKQIDRFVRLHPQPFSAVRGKLLQFCLDEFVDPEWVGQRADRASGHGLFRSSWSEEIARDGPVRYVYAAFHAFWG